MAQSLESFMKESLQEFPNRFNIDSLCFENKSLK